MKSISSTTAEPTFSRPRSYTPEGDIAGRRASVSQPCGPEARHGACLMQQARDSQVSQGRRYSYSPADPQARRDRSPSDNFPDNESKHERWPDGDGYGASLGRDSVDSALDLDDEQELSSQQSAGTPMTLDQAMAAVQQRAALLVATLAGGQVQDDGRNDGGMYLVMSAAGKAFRQLLAHGMPFGEALAVFTKAAGDAFLDLDSSELGKVCDGLERLDFYSQDSNRNVLHRTFATAILEMKPAQLRRAALDKERAQQPPPETVGDMAEQAMLGVWRKTKRSGQAIDRKIGGVNRLARQSDEARAKARGAVDAALRKTMRVAIAGGPARDATIGVNLALLTSPSLYQSDDESPDHSIDEFLAFAEDFLVTQDTNELIRFSGALVETAPSRRRQDVKLNALGESLRAVLAMRPATEEVTCQLRMTPLSGEPPAQVLDAFRRERVAEALRSLARPDVTTNPIGPKFVEAILMGLHCAIPPAEDREFAERMQIGLRKCSVEQLRQIATNIKFVYSPIQIGRVTTVFGLVESELRQRARGPEGAELDAAPVAGAAAASQVKSQSQLMLEAVARTLALTLSNPPRASPEEDAALITRCLSEAGEQVRRFMDEGASFRRAILTFGATAEATFLGMDSHALKRLSKGMERLDNLPAPANGAIVRRHLVEALQKFNAEGVYRVKLDAARKNAPAPTGFTGTLKGAGLKGWRALKQTARSAEKAVAEPRAEREAAKRIDFRSEIFKAMEDAVAATLPGTAARDTSLRVALGKLMRAANFEGARIDGDEGQRFLALAEDFLLAQRTDALVGFARELMRTAPTRLTPDVRLDRLGMSLAEVLEMRPGTQDVVDALRQRGSISGPVSADDLDQWRATRFDELLREMSNPLGPQDADARAAARGAIEDLADIINTIDEQTLPGRPTVQRFLDDSAAGLTRAHRDAIRRMLQSDRLNSRYENVINQVLHALREPSPAAVEAS